MLVFLCIKSVLPPFSFQNLHQKSKFYILIFTCLRFRFSFWLLFHVLLFWIFTQSVVTVFFDNFNLIFRKTNFEIIYRTVEGKYTGRAVRCIGSSAQCTLCRSLTKLLFGLSFLFLTCIIDIRKKSKEGKMFSGGLFWQKPKSSEAGGLRSKPHPLESKGSCGRSLQRLEIIQFLIKIMLFRNI